MDSEALKTVGVTTGVKKILKVVSERIDGNSTSPINHDVTLKKRKGNNRTCSGDFDGKKIKMISVEKGGPIESYFTRQSTTSNAMVSTG